MFKSKDKPADWIIDSVIQYICSPLFYEPILNFIEDRCLVFDSSEENKFSYTEVHQDYGKLIDSQLGNFMNDTGINPNDFASALALDIDAHQGVNMVALKDAFKHIEAVDNFLQFKNTMVQKNTELNNKAMEILERYGMLTPSSRQQTSSQSSDFRNADSPPPPYPEREEYQEDNIKPKQPVGDETVEKYVKNLSTNLQQFDDAVRDQQEAIKSNIGVELEDSRLLMDLIHLTEQKEIPLQQNKLYPTLDQSENETFLQSSPTEQLSDQQDKAEFDTNILQHVDLLIDTEDQTKLPPISTENLTRQVLPKLHSRHIQQYTDNSPEKHIDILNEERELSEISTEDNRVQSPVEAADSLTLQWMEYAKDQQSIWKSSKEIAPIGKSEPSKEDLATREDHFRRQRDLLRNQRKMSKEQISEQTVSPPQNKELRNASPELRYSSIESSDARLKDDEKDRAMAEDAKRFRRALSAKLKKEVIDKHR